MSFEILPEVAQKGNDLVAELISTCIYLLILSSPLLLLLLLLLIFFFLDENFLPGLCYKTALG